LITGATTVDQLDIYTDTIPPAARDAKPDVREIQNHVVREPFVRNSADSGFFKIRQINSNMTGTMMIYFNIRYKKVT
jgi:hypothetical protein